MLLDYQALQAVGGFVPCSRNPGGEPTYTQTLAHLLKNLMCVEDGQRGTVIEHSYSPL